MNESPRTDILREQLKRTNDLEQLRAMAVLACSMMEYDLRKAEARVTDLTQKHEYNLGLLKGLEVIVKHTDKEQTNRGN